MLSVFIFLIHLLSCILWSVAMHNDKTMMSELCEDDLDNCFVHVFYEVGALTGGIPTPMTDDDDDDDCVPLPCTV
jgi:hypothetical protein